MAVKNRLKELRGLKSQKKMAEIFGVSQQAWSKWESGAASPCKALMLEIERYFKMPMEAIFFDVFNYKIE